MKQTMLEILACPIDRHSPLELYVCEKSNDEISEGALYCTTCSRFYPIIKNIPILLPDDLRDKELDANFLEKNKNTLPEKITMASQQK